MRQMTAQVEPGDRHRDDDSENHRAHETDQREPAIERNVGTERQTIRAENFEQPNPPGSDNEPEQSADESQENGFDHYLSHNMRATRAHRSADRHFFRAAIRADQNEVDQINRSDEQKKKHAGLHKQEGWTNRADVLRMQWPNERSETRFDHHLRFRIVFFDGGVVRVDL